MKNKHIINITTQPINIINAFSLVSDERFGGTASFLGTIRNRNLEKDVIGVSYDVHEALAHNVLNQLCLECEEKWGADLRIYIAHFKGRLSVGDISVLIVVGSPHRDEAFQACRYIIEEIKHRCPIWKQEHYKEGNSEWVKGHALCQHV